MKKKDLIGIMALMRVHYWESTVHSESQQEKVGCLEGFFELLCDLLQEYLEKSSESD